MNKNAEIQLLRARDIKYLEEKQILWLEVDGELRQALYVTGRQNINSTAGTGSDVWPSD